MTETLYILFFTAFAVMLELILRSFGLFLPLAALFLFYAATVFGCRAAGAAALLAACGLDFVSGSPHLWSLPAFALVIAFSWFWLNRVESESILLHAVPGALIVPLIWLCRLPFFPDRLLLNVLTQLPDVVTASVVCALLLPLEIYLFDTMNEKLGIDLYTDAKIRLHNEL